MVSSWGPYTALSAPPIYIYRQRRWFCNPALWCHCLSQKLTGASEHVSSTPPGPILKVDSCSSFDIVPNIYCSPLCENYTFPTSVLGFSYITCFGQWNMSESDMYHSWGRAFTAIVGSHHLSFLSSWEMVMCQIRAAPSALILEWRKCETG